MATIATKLNINTKATPPKGPYRVEFTIAGVKPILLHAYNPEAVKQTTEEAKGGKKKKCDTPEDYVYRNAEGHICLPGMNIHSCLIEQGRSRQDPRSPRKSARDLMKAAICPDLEMIPFNGGISDWEFLDERGVGMNGGSRITRVRPGLLAGWNLTAIFSVLLPQYVEPGWLLALINEAGAVQGLGDFRPVFGRFQCVNFEVLED